MDNDYFIIDNDHLQSEISLDHCSAARVAAPVGAFKTQEKLRHGTIATIQTRTTPIMKGIKRSAPGAAAAASSDTGSDDLLDRKNLPAEEEDSDGSNDVELPSTKASKTKQSNSQEAQDDGKGGGGGGGGGGSQVKRQKVEQLHEMPLLIPAAVCKDNKASLLVHLRDETLNFAGDTGAVGRMSVRSKKSKGSRLTFDLKGQQFDGQIIPSATVLVVGVGKTEAKVEGLFSEVCRLDYRGNVLDAMGGQVLKGEMDKSYRFEDEDVNARGGGGVVADGASMSDEGGNEGGMKAKAGGKTPKSGRKKAVSSTSKKASAGGKKGSGKGSSSKRGAKAGSK